MDRATLITASMRTADALRSGATRSELRGPRWETRSYGLVRPPLDEDNAVDAHVSDAIALLTGDSALGGWASLWFQGNTWFDGTRADGRRKPALVMCSSTSQLRRREGIAPFRGLVHPDETIELAGVRIATLARAAFDEMRLAPSWRDAVVVMDMATSTTSGTPRCTVEAVQRVLAAHRKIRGRIQAERALLAGSTRSASPLETRTRLVAAFDVGIKEVLVNVPIFGRQGELLGVADLLDPEAGLVIESDGAVHRAEQQHANDNVREEGFERAGLVVSRVTSLDHRNRVTLAGRITAARRDALANRTGSWTLEPPAWWSTWSGARRWA